MSSNDALFIAPDPLRTSIRYEYGGLVLAITAHFSRLLPPYPYPTPAKDIRRPHFDPVTEGNSPIFYLD